MSYPIDRVQLFDRDMNPLRELAPSEVFSRVRTEEVNGEHALVIVTTRRLEEGWRALTVDGTGKWREWVLTEPDESHESGKTAIGTYRFVWSLQYDLTYSYFHDTGEGVSIGMGSDTLASVAAQHVLEGVAGWSVGPCDAPDIAAGTGCVFIRESAWSKLSKLVECSGVEVDSIIEVSNLYGVTARKLCLRSHVGNEEALLRFDWSRDLTGIRRTPDPGPYYCRVVPLGKGETEYADDDETTYEYPIDITEEPDGHGGYYPYYLQDDDAALAFRIKAGDGTYVYPTIAVSYSEDDPELLLNAALAELHDYTRPGVTYEADVVQLAQAGMDVRGVALGDEVQCVDYGFNPDAGLRIQGRVLKMEVDELSPETTTQLTIGQLRDSMTTLMKDMGQSLDDLQRNNEKITDQMRSMTTARYIDELLDRINAEINATGGYAYFVPGEGIITYDVAVADPLVGSEATQVVQIKGGSIRIANTKNTQFSGIDDWNWRTVFTANGINADLITTLHAIAGYLGNATNSSYWNLDTGELITRRQYLPNYFMESRISNVTISSDDWFDLTGYVAPRSDIYGFRTAYVNIDNNGNETPLSYIAFYPQGSNYRSSGSYQWDSIASSHSLAIWSGMEDPSGKSLIFMNPNLIDIAAGGDVSYGGSRSTPRLSLTNSEITAYGSFICNDGLTASNAATFNKGATFGGGTVSIGSVLTATYSSSYSRYTGISTGDISSSGTIDCSTLNVGTSSSNGNARVYGNLYVYDGTLSCSGTVSSNIKSRVIDTENYGDRLLFCYETATPMFGDIGSGHTDEDGYCYIELDDRLRETTRLDKPYQVFLQKCGDGDLWVKEKNPAYFVVRGTPNLSFDWEVKARQVGLESIRLEEKNIYLSDQDGVAEAGRTATKMSEEYGDYLARAIAESEAIEELYDDPVSQLERIYDDELRAA